MTKSTVYEYKRIRDLHEGNSLNFWGRVISIRPPRSTRGSDLCMNLVVSDDSLGGPDEGIAVNIFRKSPEDFPPVEAVGEIVQFRHLRIQTYQQSLQAISTMWSAFTVFYRGEGGGSWRVRPSNRIAMPHEIQVLERLGNPTIEEPSSPAYPSPEKRRRKHRQLLTIAQLDPNQHEYFDLIGEILHKSQPNGSAIDLVLCDYTEGGLGLLGGTRPETYGLPADLSRRLLPCTFWDEHYEQARNLLPGQLIRVDNLHGKIIPASASGGGNVLVASLHGGRTCEPVPRIRVLEAGEEMAAGLIRRRERFLETRKAMADIGRLSPSSSASPSSSSSSPSSSSESPSSPSSSPSSSSDNCPTRLINDPDGGEPSSIQSVLAATTNMDPDQPSRLFKIRARVIGHSPTKVADFTRPYCPACRTTWPWDAESNCPGCDKPPSSFAYMFCLVVDDGTGEVPLIVCYKDAARFLGPNYPPVNLHTDPDSLARMRALMKHLLAHPTPAIFAIRAYRVASSSNDHDDDDDVSGKDGIAASLRFRVTNTTLTSD